MAEASPTSAENKTGLDNFGKALAKTVNRTKEKVMQSFGRNDRTIDEQFDQASSVFTEQQITASRLNNEFKNYMKNVKALMVSSESLHAAIKGAYESQWPESSVYDDHCQKMTENWANYMDALEKAQVHISTYAEKFQDLKQKIAKRGRKQTDYDSARHTVQSLDTAKRRDSFKLTKAQTEMTLAKNVYENLNMELLTELKVFYESRVPSICTYLSMLFQGEAEFLAECAKIKAQLAEAARTAAATRSSVGRNFNAYSSRDSTQSSEDARSSESPAGYASFGKSAANNEYESAGDYERMESKMTSSVDSTSPAIQIPPLASPQSPTSQSSRDSSSFSSLVAEQTSPVNGVEPIYSTPVKNVRSTGELEAPTITVTPPLLLDLNEGSAVSATIKNPLANIPVKYQVQAVYDYEPCDDDELAFKIGDTINIVDFDDPDDEDEGWLMGINTTTGQKGILPQNFTKKI